MTPPEGARTRLSPIGSRPIWTADGQRVTFQMGGSLYSVPADDSGQPRLVLEREDRFSGLYPLAWSRNGRVLMFSAPARATNRDVWMLPSGSAITPFLVTPRDERAAMFSPDGRWVVYAARETGREEQVYVQPYPGAWWPRVDLARRRDRTRLVANGPRDFLSLERWHAHHERRGAHRADPDHWRLTGSVRREIHQL